MEKPVTNADTPAVRFVERPQSYWMSLFNGAGNGAMIGGSALVAHNIWKHTHDVKTKGIPRDKVHIAATAVTGICTAIGAVYGIREAKQVNSFRAALANDIETLHAQVDGMDPKVVR